MNNKIINFSDETFKIEIEKDEKLILVDFWADWCNPCKIISNILDDIFNEYSSKIIIGKLNIDKSNKTAILYNIKSIPTLILFKNKKILNKHIGLISKKKLKDFLNEYI